MQYARENDFGGEKSFGEGRFPGQEMSVVVHVARYSQSRKVVQVNESPLDSLLCKLKAVLACVSDGGGDWIGTRQRKGPGPVYQ